MSYSYSKTKTGTSSQAFEDSKKKSTFLKDNSWIKRAENVDEPTERDTNFGKAVLGRFKSQEGPNSKPSETSKPDTVNQGTSVHTVSKMFRSSQDEVSGNSTPSPTTSKFSSSSTSSSKSFITNNDKTTDTTVTTITSTRSSGLRSPLKGDVVTDWAPNTTSRVTSTKTTKTEVTPVMPAKDGTEVMTAISSTKTIEPAPLSPLKKTFVSSTRPKPEVPPKRDSESSTVSVTKTVKTEVTPVTPSKDSSDRTTTISTVRTTKTELSPSKDSSESSTIVSITKPTVNELAPVTPTTDSGDRSYFKTTVTSPTRTRSSFTTYSSDYSPATRLSTSIFDTTYPEPSFERSSFSSSTVYTTPSYTSTRPVDYLSDDVFSTSSKTLYSVNERTVLEKDICSSCRKPMNTEPKMILSDIQINCHATCFKVPYPQPRKYSICIMKEFITLLSWVYLEAESLDIPKHVQK